MTAYGLFLRDSSPIVLRGNMGALFFLLKNVYNLGAFCLIDLMRPYC